MSDATRVLVTGGAGFIGSHVARTLAADGQAVRILSRDAVRARPVVPDGITIVEGDIRDGDAVARAVNGVDVVYHLVSSFRQADIADREHRDVNVEGTRVLLHAARAAGIRRFVHISTIGVLGHIAHPPANETTAYNPGDIYQVTKTEAEQLALAFQREHDFPLTVARPASVYGPGDTRLLKLFRMIARRRFLMIGTGEVCFHMVYIDDLVRGLHLLSHRPEAVGEIFILGGQEYCPLRELVRRIAAVVDAPVPRLRIPARPVQWAGTLCEKVCVPLGINPPIYRRRVDFFTKSRAFDVTKADEVLGFRADVSLDEGLRRAAEWYGDHGWL